jgi:hypothetical protein
VLYLIFRLGKQVSDPYGSLDGAAHVANHQVILLVDHARELGELIDYLEVHRTASKRARLSRASCSSAALSIHCSIVRPAVAAAALIFRCFSELTIACTRFRFS